jgi:hypothetical protein
MRNHPFMTYRGQPNWPPKWTWTGKGENKRPLGEVGILKEVHTSITDRRSPEAVAPYCRIHLFIEYRDGSYIGTLFFDDPAACRRIGDLLSTQCGKTIQEIGDLDLGHFL